MSFNLNPSDSEDDNQDYHAVYVGGSTFQDDSEDQERWPLDTGKTAEGEDEEEEEEEGEEEEFDPMVIRKYGRTKSTGNDTSTYNPSYGGHSNSEPPTTSEKDIEEGTAQTLTEEAQTLEPPWSEVDAMAMSINLSIHGQEEMEADLGVPKNLHTIRGVINRLGNLNAVHPSMSQLEYVYLVYKIVHLGLRSTASFKSILKSAPTKQLAHYVRGGLNLLGIIDDSVYDRTLRAPKVAIPAIITPQALLMNMLCEELSQLVLSLVSRGLVRSAFYRPELADDRRQFMLVTLGTKHKFMMVADAHPLGKPEVIIAEWLQGYYPVEEGLVALINRTIPEPHTLVPGDFLSMDPESVRSLEEEMVVNPGNLFFDEGTHPRPDRRGKPKPGKMVDSTTIIQSQETALRSTCSATKKKDRTQETDEEAPVLKKSNPSTRSKTPKKKKLSLLQKKVRGKYVKYPDTTSETEEEEESYPMTRDYKRVRVEDLQLDEIRNLSKESYKAFKKNLGVSYGLTTSSEEPGDSESDTPPQVDPQNLLNNPAFQFSAKHQEKLVKAVKGKKSKGVTVSQKKAKATTKLALPFPDLGPYMDQETINDGAV
eukprot:gene39800-48458_t